MHIYAFGSICRGEVDPFSDIDMLAIVDEKDDRFNIKDYSVYSYNRIEELWRQGNAFAWHLFWESRLIYSSNNIDYLRDISEPSIYISGIKDCNKFYEIFLSAKKSIEESHLTEIFDLSSIFLSIRNFATCYSLHVGIKPDFSRNSALNLGQHSIPIDNLSYELLEKSRILCTRGKGDILNRDDINVVKSVLYQIEYWMNEKMTLIIGDGSE